MKFGLKDLSSFDFISFDVFDTAIGRKTIQPSDVFDLVFRRAQVEFPKIHFRFPFRKARMLAEWIARKRSAYQEVNLKEIYTELAWILKLDQVSSQKLLDFELKIESEIVYPISFTQSLVHEILAQKKKLAFISDTYLSTAEVSRLLKSCGYPVESMPIFTSSDLRKTKYHGSIFQTLSKELSIPFSNWAHIGDNQRSDIKMPSELGIQTFHHPIDGYKGREWQEFAARPFFKSHRKAIYHTSLATHRFLRQSSDRSEAEEIGAAFIAPIFLPFVIWLLRSSQKQKLQKIYFLARDGLIFLKLAEILSRRLELSFDLKYLYVSRQSLNLPTWGLKTNDRNWIFETSTQLSIKKMAGRIGLEPDDLVNELTKLGIHAKDSNQFLSTVDIAFIKSKLPHSDLSEKINFTAARYRKNALAYLKQEGLESESAAIVDIGWRGSLQDRIETLIGKSARLRGFYFGLTPDAQYRENKMAFLFSLFKNPLRGFIGLQCIVLLEALTRAPHGSTRAYQDQGDKIEPIFSGISHDENLAKIHQGILMWADSLPIDLLNYYWTCKDSELIRISFRNLLKIKFFPDSILAEQIGSIRFSADQGETETGELAPVLPTGAIAIALMAKHFCFPAKLTFWIEASIKRSQTCIPLSLANGVRQIILILWLPLKLIFR